MMRCGFVVRGRVQGVGYRAFTVAAARKAGVSGFVHNDADGSVSGEAEGEPAAVDAFLAALRRGPTFARVASVDSEPMPAIGSIGFAVR